MTEIYIPLEQAAGLEGADYFTLAKRVKRNPDDYKTHEEPRPGGGKPLVSVALSSLSKTARKAYKAAQKVDGGEALQNAKTQGECPWYVDVDFSWFLENHKKEYYKMVEMKNHVLEFLQFDEAGRTEHSEEFGQKLGISGRTLYRYTKDVLEASAWAQKMEAKNGRSYDYYQVLCLCRKPRKVDNFPSLVPAVRIFIERSWFDEKFRANKSTRQMLFDKLKTHCTMNNLELPSYQTVSRYINQLLKSPNGESAAYLAEYGVVAWKNKYMMKGVRDLTQLEVMELVLGDEHRFDLWVSYVSANGVRIAVRPMVIAWIEARSRRLVGYSMCVNPNAQDVKSSFAKMSRDFGTPKSMHIDNGKDYTAEEMTGKKRSDREGYMTLDAEMQGFYHAMGVQEIVRSLPYQPWDKGVVERYFGSVCQRFSKQFDSYVGTLTGSKTSGKVKKNIQKLLEQGKLFTLEEFYDLFDNWVKEEDNHRTHRGLVDSGEKYTTPISLFENAEERYYKPSPPDSYIAMLLMKARTAAVRTTGIQCNKRLYMSDELTPYINQKVQIRYMPDDDSQIYVFSELGELIGEIPLAEKLNPRAYQDMDQLERHKAKQNRQLRSVRDTLEGYRREAATPHLVGGVDLTVGRKPENNAVYMPQDKQYRQVESRKKKTQPNQFIDDIAEDSIEKIRQAQ